MYWLNYLFFFVIFFFEGGSLWASDILSLSSFEKREKKIYIVGVFDQARGERVDTSFIVEKLDPFIQQLSKKQEKTGFLLFESKESIEKIAKADFHSFYDLLSVYARSLNYSLGNLVFSVFSDKDHVIDSAKAFNSTAFFCNFNDFARYADVLKFPKSTILGLDKYFVSRPKERKAFFGQRGKFNLLKEKAIGAIVKHLTEEFLFVKEYKMLLEFMDNKIMSGFNDEIFADLKRRWKMAKSDASMYLSTNCRDDNCTMLELVFNEISSKGSFLGGIQSSELILLEPIHLFNLFLELALIVENSIRFDTIIFCYRFSVISKVIDLVKKIGFDGKTQGLVLSGINEIRSISFKKNIFSPEEIHDFFGSILGHDKYNLDPSLQKKEDDGVSFFFFDPISGGTSEKFVLDHEVKSCLGCHLSIEAHRASAEVENGIYCSTECLLNKLLFDNKRLSNLLNENTPLGKDDETLLKQVGALCFIHYARLIPSMLHSGGLFYQLPHAKFAELISQIMKAPTTDTSSVSARVVTLAKSCGIDLMSLNIFFQVYERTKKDYLQGLFKNFGASYDEPEFLKGLSFDEKGSLANLQKGVFPKLKQSFKFSDKTKDMSLIFLYGELIKQIGKRVNLSLEGLEAALAVQYQKADLAATLDFLGYKEKPMIFVKRSIVSEIDESFVKEESSDEEIIQTPSPELLPNIENEDKGFQVVQRKQRKKIHTMTSWFAGCKPYEITLFKAREFVPTELQSAQKAWKECNQINEAYRIKMIFALAEIAQGQWEVFSNAYGTFVLACTDEKYHVSLREKLDLDHLFTKKVDGYLKSCGIAEEVGNLIQVSIPGEISDENGKKVGFFQYSFTRDTWVCIHRCFKNYDATTYVTPALRKILHDFLKMSCNNDEYKEIIEKL